MLRTMKEYEENFFESGIKNRSFPIYVISTNPDKEKSKTMNFKQYLEELYGVAKKRENMVTKLKDKFHKTENMSLTDLQSMHQEAKDIYEALEKEDLNYEKRKTNSPVDDVKDIITDFVTKIEQKMEKLASEEMHEMKDSNKKDIHLKHERMPEVLITKQLRGIESESAELMKNEVIEENSKSVNNLKEKNDIIEDKETSSYHKANRRSESQNEITKTNISVTMEVPQEDIVKKNDTNKNVIPLHREEIPDVLITQQLRELKSEIEEPSNSMKNELPKKDTAKMDALNKRDIPATSEDNVQTTSHLSEEQPQKVEATGTNLNKVMTFIKSIFNLSKDFVFSFFE